MVEVWIESGVRTGFGALLEPWPELKAAIGFSGRSWRTGRVWAGLPKESAVPFGVGVCSESRVSGSAADS